MSAKSSSTSKSRWRILVESFGHAIAGLWYAIRSQQNMRIHLATTACVVVLGLYLGLELVHWAILGLTIGSVLVSEMFNTVAEAAMDAATPHYDPLVKVAKDVAAGAVLLTALIAIAIGVIILGPPLRKKIVGWFIQ